MDHSTSRVERAVHGALDYSELERLGLDAEEVLDFSVNANPYGPSPCVREAMANTAIDRYPDRECLELRRAILKYELAGVDLPLSSIVCGNGTAELIWAIARAYLKPGLKAAISGPTFGEYRVACLATGATMVEFRAQASAGFQPDIVAVATWIRNEQPSLVWLCNPNNPTGTWLDTHHLQPVIEACQKVGAVLVIDEAYWRFVFPHETSSAVELVDAHTMNLNEQDRHYHPSLRSGSGLMGTEILRCAQDDSLAPLQTLLPNLVVKNHYRGSTRPLIIVLRSLTKDFALTGLRLGYAVAAPDVAELLSRQLPSWNVNAFAQSAGVAALTDRTHLTITLEKLVVERQAFFQALRDTGLPAMPSRTHFCLVEVGNACHVRQQLLQRKILVRDCASFGLPQFIRIATRPRGDWQRLLLALQEIV